MCRFEFWQIFVSVYGSIEFGGNLPVVAGRRLQSIVQAVSDRRYRAAKDRRDRLALQETPQQRAADALVEILDAAEAVERGEAKTPSIPAGSAQLQVLIPYQDLLDRAAASGLLTDCTRLSAGELRVLACGAELIPAVLGSESQVLDMGQTVRLAPPSLRRAIDLRDGGCAFPGCTTPMRHCDLHHIRPCNRAGPPTGTTSWPCAAFTPCANPDLPPPGQTGDRSSPTGGTSGSTATDSRSSFRPRRWTHSNAGPPSGPRGNSVRP